MPRKTGLVPGPVKTEIKVECIVKASSEEGGVGEDESEHSKEQTNREHDSHGRRRGFNTES